MSVSTVIWGKAVVRPENAEPHFLHAGVRGLKVLPPHGAWVTEVMCDSDKHAVYRNMLTGSNVIYPEDGSI